MLFSFTPRSAITIIFTCFFIGCHSESPEKKDSTFQQTKDEKIVLTEYSDYQCPACARYHPIVKKLKAHFQDKIDVKLRFFPLNSHQYGALSARAAQAARNQNKFYEMHALLFETQQRWSQSEDPASIFIKYAHRLNLDVKQFKEDLNSAETQKIVMQQKNQGEQRELQAHQPFLLMG